MRRQDSWAELLLVRAQGTYPGNEQADVGLVVDALIVIRKGVEDSEAVGEMSTTLNM